MKTCVFAGTFDPVTVGHKAIVDGLVKKGYSVIVVIGENPEKAAFFTEEERFCLLKAAFYGQKGVRVIKYSDYKDGYKEFLKTASVTTYFRGIRDLKDYEYEKKSEERNKNLYPFIKTEYINSHKKYAKISSSFIKERVKAGKDVKKYIPKKAYKPFKKILTEKYKGKN